jgi:hypothetical protein
MEVFCVGERERLLPTGDRERLSCSLEMRASVVGLSDLERLMSRSCFVGLPFLFSDRLQRYDFR